MRPTKTTDFEIRKGYKGYDQVNLSEIENTSFRSETYLHKEDIHGSIAHKTKRLSANNRLHEIVASKSANTTRQHFRLMYRYFNCELKSNEENVEEIPLRIVQRAFGLVAHSGKKYPEKVNSSLIERRNQTVAKIIG